MHYVGSTSTSGLPAAVEMVPDHAVVASFSSKTLMTLAAMFTLFLKVRNALRTFLVLPERHRVCVIPCDSV